MLAPTNGNMSEVYAEFWRMQEIADDAERRINIDIAVSCGVFAEITEGSTANWYLVRTYPGDDMRALRWLARRRFGAFRPMQQRWQRNALVHGWQAQFPGWLFVYTWDIAKMQHRIRSCPGVMDILCFPATGQPVPICDEFVRDLQAKSWEYNDYASWATRAAARHSRRRPHRSHRIKKAFNRTA
jgi:hypothetical protein